MPVFFTLPGFYPANHPGFFDPGFTKEIPDRKTEEVEP
jgi:hypothetical protein